MNEQANRKEDKTDQDDRNEVKARKLLIHAILQHPAPDNEDASASRANISSSAATSEDGTVDHLDARSIASVTMEVDRLVRPREPSKKEDVDCERPTTSAPACLERGTAVSMPGAFAILPNDISRAETACMEDHQSESQWQPDPNTPIVAAEVTDDHLARMEEEIRERIIHDNRSGELHRMRQELEQTLKEELLEQVLHAPMAQAVGIPSGVNDADPEDLPGGKHFPKRKHLLVGAVLFLIAIIVGVILGLAPWQRESNSSPTSNIDSIRARGVVRCGVFIETPVFVYKSDDDDDDGNEEYLGLGVDMVRSNDLDNMMLWPNLCC